jgi:hypothetical protein
MTVEVETPKGLRSGSSVIEVSGSLGSKYAPGEAAGKLNSQARGEAVAVDLPGGRTLFALLSRPGESDGATGYAEAGLHVTYYGEDGGYARTMREMVQRRDVGVLPPKGYPMLVTFADLRDPKSVVGVDPNELAKSFGPGVKLKRITVQITDDPVTSGIEKRLGWLASMKHSLVQQNMSAPAGKPLPFGVSVGPGDFSMGTTK